MRFIQDIVYTLKYINPKLAGTRKRLDQSVRLVTHTDEVAIIQMEETAVGGDLGSSPNGFTV